MPATYHPAAALLPCLLCLALAAPAVASDLSFLESSLQLPGAPAALVPGDLDGDGLGDLAVVVVYTEWDQVGITEQTEMDDIEGLVEVLTIVPVLFDRREIRVFRGLPEGGFAPVALVAELPLSVLSMEPGPPGLPVVALTDSGLAELVLEGSTPAFRPLVDDPPATAGTGAFLADLDLVRDLTGDGVADVVVPTFDGLALYPGTGSGLAAEPVSRTQPPEADEGSVGTRIDVPLPRVEDLDGDGLPDLLYHLARTGAGDSRRFVRRNLGDGRFGEAVRIDGGDEDEKEGEDESAEDDGDGGDEGDGGFAHLGRLVPDGPASAIFLDEQGPGDDAGLREEMEHARAPRYLLHARPVGEDLTVSGAAGPESEIEGYLMSDEDGDLPLPGGVQDLDGDGLADLVTVTNDISLMKALAVLATRRLTLDLGFHTWCQQPDGRFVRAPGEPLESRLTINLNDLEIRRRSLFAGDFDGDGRADFVQLGKTREVGLHLGRAHCSYGERPDVEIRLSGELRSLALAEARDLDGDGLTDLAVTHPRPVGEAGVSAPVRLDVYLSRTGGAR